MPPKQTKTKSADKKAARTKQTAPENNDATDSYMNSELDLALRKALKEIEDLKAENERLKLGDMATKVAALEQEKEDLKTRNQTLYADLQKANHNITKKDNYLNRPSKQVNSSEADPNINDTKNDDKQELVKNIGFHQEELRKANTKRDEIQKQLVEMTKKRDELQTKVQQLESTQTHQREAQDTEQSSKIKHLTNEKEDIQKQLVEMTKKRDELQAKVQQLESTQTHQSVEQEKKITKLQKENNRLEKEMETKDEEMKKLNHQLESRGQKKENKKGDSSSTEKISRLEEEVEGLRNRLSKIAGAQLVDNNPAIADLSDPNRPLSLGEKFSELYDNEWTDAMEELSDSLDERAVIKQLLDIVVDSYQFCCVQSNEFMDRINGTLKRFSTNLVSEMPKEISKTNKDFRKSLAVHCVYHLQEEFTNKKSRANAGKKTKDYMKKCVQVCWFMTVQDPKVVINHKVTGQFDEDRFKAYTKKGKQVDYLVWPALHLHEGGPMIGKGVVQGK